MRTASTRTRRPPATTTAATPPSATSAARRKPWPASPGARAPLVERPVRELGGKEQAQRDHRHRDVERCVVDGELDRVRSADERDGHGNERRPAEDDRDHESHERDHRDACSRLLEGAVSARERHGCDREEADDTADRGDYARTGRA